MERKASASKGKRRTDRSISSLSRKKGGPPKENMSALDKYGEENHHDRVSADESTNNTEEELSQAERVARLQQYRQGVWELNFDYRAFMRWRKVGEARGLTDDTQIACFLLQEYEKSKAEKPAEPSVCSKCESPLALCCRKCDLRPPSPSDQESPTDADTVTENGTESGLRNLLNSSVTLKEEKVRLAAYKKGQKFSCSVCDMVFARPSSLNSHMRKHTGEKPFVCSDCGAMFRHSSSLSVHKRTHSGEKPFVCEECGAAFTVASILKQHMRKHTGEKPYRCSLCQASFTQPSKLTVHMRKHTGDRPYQCEHCGASFTNSDRLKIHLRSHSGLKPYKCQDCGKCFSQSAHLTVHTRIHTGEKPFKCSVCDAAFMDSTHLRRHERTHSGIRPHKCRECGSSYSTKFGLRRHEWSHTDSKKPFSCDACDKSFTVSHDLKRHKLKGRCKGRETTPSPSQPQAGSVLQESFGFQQDSLSSHQNLFTAHQNNALVPTRQDPYSAQATAV